VISRFLSIIGLWFSKAFEHRAELLVWAFLTVFNTAIYLCIWVALFRGEPSVLGYNLGQILHYYLIATIINGITASHFESWRGREVREGKIDHYLTKPIPYPTQVLLADIGNRLTYITIILPLCVLMYLGYFFFFQIDVLSTQPIVLLQFFGLLIFGYIIEFSFAFIAVILTFWFESGEGIEHFKWIIMSIFTGYLIPVEFMPAWLRAVIEVLPLKYVYSVPIQILQGRMSLETFDVLYIFFTIGVLYFIQSFLWQKAVKRYTSAGG
jgi:ABC-2 type transport system permease protein